METWFCTWVAKFAEIGARGRLLLWGIVCGVVVLVVVVVLSGGVGGLICVLSWHFCCDVVAMVWAWVAS